MHNLPPRLSYVYLTLHKNGNATLTSWSIHTWTVFLRASLTKPLTGGKHGGVHV